jgi:hypothetical protein
MLNAGVLRFDAAGRIRNTSALPTDFNGGTPTNQGLLSWVGGAPVAFNGGLGYLTDMRLVAANAAPVAWNGGIACSAASQVCVDGTGAGVITGYVNGLPIDAAGKLVLASAELPAVVDAFDSAFSGAFG